MGRLMGRLTDWLRRLTGRVEPKVTPVAAAKARPTVSRVRQMLDARFPDTSRRGTRRERGLPLMRRPRVPRRRFFPLFTPDRQQVKAPKGYAFNGRGDLVKLKREALRSGREVAA